jgi:hypothetical protein
LPGDKPIDKFYPDGGYGDRVYDEATDAFVYISYRGHKLVQYRVRLQNRAGNTGGEVR